MSTVLFVNGPAFGHVYPTLGIVEELIAQGEQVVYVSSEEFREKLERIGATFVAYDNFLLGDDPFHTNRHFLSLVIKILSSYDVILPCIYELAQNYHFDYMIHDSMYGCGNVAADWLRIPNVATCTSFILAERLYNDASEDQTKLKENLRLIKEFSTLSRKIWSTYRIKRKMDINEIFFNEGKLNLVFTSEFFQPQSESLKPHYKFVGPILAERNEQISLPVMGNGRQKIIYISMGTMFNDVQKFYQLAFEALGALDAHVVLSIGKRIQIEALGSIPNNFTVLPYVPQLQILQEADLFITHGGMNSVNEGLYYGVPLLVIPLAADQPIVANRVAELGAGKSLDKDTITAASLLETVRGLLHEQSYRTNSLKIGASLRAAGGQRKAIEHILAFKHAQGIRDGQLSL